MKRILSLFFLETRQEIPHIHTLYLPFYGVNYAAGRLAQQMSDVNRVAIFQANEQLAILQEATRGFTDGFQAGEGELLNTYIMDEGFLGFSMADKLYQEAYRRGCRGRGHVCRPLFRLPD